MLELALILLLAVSTGAVDFTCPTSPISQLTPTGNLPVGATSALTVPKGTNCTFQFNIPKGYALQFLISGASTSALDYVQVLDNRGVLRTIINGTSVPSAELWMGNSAAQIRVVGATGGSSFFTKYTYKSLAGFQQNKKNTGDYVALSSIKGNTYYTFTSQKNDRVRATVGRMAGANDTTSQKFAVFSGADLTTADHMGSLYDVSSDQLASLGNALSIVNLYGVSSDLYIMANDAKSLSGILNYGVLMTSLNHGIQATVNGIIDTMVTYVCLDCSRFYMTKFMFDTGLSYNTGFVALQGQTPTHGLDKLIVYSTQTYTSVQMPQLIPTNMFTATYHMSRAIMTVAAKNDYDEWKKASDGRMGYVFSPNLWNPAGPFTFNEEFRGNSSQLYKFTLNMDRMNFGSNTDTLNLKIGPTSGNPSVNNQYPRDKSSNGKVISNGNYMGLDYRGSAKGDIRLSFEMAVVKGSASIGIIASLVVLLHNLL